MSGVSGIRSGPAGRAPRGVETGSEGAEVEALVTDRYLEALLEAHARGADSSPAIAWTDPIARAAADRLARDLPRLHPSFRFEEALAARLDEAATRIHLQLAADDETHRLPRRRRGLLLAFVPADDDIGQIQPGDRLALRRPLLLGGALTSAALSLAGAAYLAWRIRRAQESPMVRAIRAVARARLA